MASSFDTQDFNAMDTSEPAPIDQVSPVGETVSSLKNILSQVGANLFRVDVSKPAPQSLPSLHPFGEVNIASLSAEFETTLLKVRSALLTFSSWQSSPDPQVKSNVKQLLGNTQSHARWNKRKEAVKKHLAETQMSAMAHSEHRLSLHKKVDRNSESTRESATETTSTALEGEQNGMASSGSNSDLFAYEHDLETRKNNLINRFEFISQLVFAKPVYPNIVAPEEQMFLTDPSAAPTPAETQGLRQSGILTDPRSMLQLTLASDHSIIDIQVNAFGKYVQVAYDYDLPSKYVSRWILEALSQGEVRAVENLIALSYSRRCLRHHNLCLSLQSQYLEATKEYVVGSHRPQSAWVTPNLNLPQVSSVHARLMSLERDLILISRTETHKYGLNSLHKGIGWMTMNARGPVVTFYTNPIKLAASASILQQHVDERHHLPEHSSKTEKIDIPSLLATACEEHFNYLSELPNIDSPHPQEITNMPAYTSNVLAPVILSRLQKLTLCSTNLGSVAETNLEATESGLMNSSLNDCLSFHVEIEQGSVLDPVTLRRVGFAPYSSHSAIASNAPVSAHPSCNHTGTTATMTTADVPNFLQFFTPTASTDTVLEDPAQFLNLNIQWTPFGHFELPEDEHLPLCAKLNLEQEMPFNYALFKRLRALAASADPAALLAFYYSVDEAHRLGKVPPKGPESAPKPKALTLRVGKAAAATKPVDPTGSKPMEAESSYVGATLASLFSVRPTFGALEAPIVEDVVMPFLTHKPAHSTGQTGSMIRCIHSHSLSTSPTCLMLRSLPFVDSRQIRPLVAILRQQAIITALYTSCFHTESTVPFSSYLFNVKGSGREMNDLRSSSSLGNAAKNLHTSGSIGPGAHLTDILASPKNRSKRSRAEMETVLNSPTSASHTDLHSSFSQTDLNASFNSTHSTENTAPAKSNTKLTIELTSLMEPLFGWSVLAKCNPSSSGQLAPQAGATPAKKQKTNEAATASSTQGILFSFAIHVSVDGHIHVVPSDMHSATTEKRTAKRLENLLRATHNLPVSLQHWLKELL